jgi:hypothetical protein
MRMMQMIETCFGPIATKKGGPTRLQGWFSASFVSVTETNKKRLLQTVAKQQLATGVREKSGEDRNPGNGFSSASKRRAILVLSQGNKTSYVCR